MMRSGEAKCTDPNRDPKTGRFLPGNRSAVGNRGNRNSKWGNRNAEKFGFFSRAVRMHPYVASDGWLVVPRDRVKIHPRAFRIEDDNIYVRADVLEKLSTRGVSR